MVIKHLENKIRLVGIICTAFLAGCIIISVFKYLDCPDNGDGRAEKGVCAGRKCTYTRNPHDDGRNTGRGGQEPRRNVPPLLFLLSHRTTNTSAIRWKKRCTWSMRRDWHSTIPSRKRDFTPIYWVRARCSRYSVTVSPLTKRIWSSPTRSAANRATGVYPDARTGYGRAT